jgi:F-type H+-transporting ATPase subunit a
MLAKSRTARVNGRTMKFCRISIGATYLFTVGGLSYVFGAVSFLMAIVMTFFELLVIFLQAYVFTVLMGTYLNGSIEAEH